MQDEVATLIEGLRRGDDSAAADLISKYETELRRFLRFQLSSPTLRRFVDSVDLCQSVFIAFVQDVRNGEHADLSGGQVRGLLLMMARNRVIDLARSQKAKKRGGGKVVSEETGVLGAAPDDRTGHETRVEQAEALDAIFAAMNPADREIVRMRMQGNSWEEVAVALGSSPDAVRRRSARAIDRAASILNSAGSD